MRIGIASPQHGRLADPAAVRAAARAADQVGYASLWVVDRLSAGPSHGPTSGGAPMLDPLVVLATVAGATDRVRIGTCVLVAPWYPPVLLARSLASLDTISEGRLVVGLGTGRSIVHDQMVGVPAGARGPRMEALLDTLEAQWGDRPARPGGPRVRSAASVDPPCRSGPPRPPILLAAHTPVALDRVARRADGWVAAGLAMDTLGPAWARVRALAAGYGRDPEALELVVRADVRLAERPVRGRRLAFRGCLDQVVDDVGAARQAGVHELVLDLGGDVGLDEALDGYARIAEASGASGLS